MDREDKERAAEHEVVFRNVNEGIDRGQWPGEGDSPVGFRCECAQLGCNVLVPMTRDEYDDVRSHPRWFVLAPGHELPEVETVVATGPGYLVVEKRGEAGEVAEDTDPRE